MKQVFSQLVLMWKLLAVALVSVCSLALPTVVQAKTTIPAGIHILHLGELSHAAELTAVPDQDVWRYVTVPFTLADLEKEEEWQRFFTEAKEAKIIPLVRLTTEYRDPAWQVPTRKNIVDMIAFLSKLEWPTEQRHIIVFNEVNHSKEWGGSINPAEYADVFLFTAQWAHTEDKGYLVLPAAMDLAAPNGRQTMEAFTYLSAMLEEHPTVFDHADAWNSHSYPNPGFSSAPERTGKNSLRGFWVELEWLKEKTDKDFLVYITETGWEVSPALTRHMPRYYEYAMTRIWSDPAVVAVTPFLLQGSPGPFEGFSFLDAQGDPTAQYIAYQNAIKKQFRESDLLSAKIDTIE